MRGRPIADDGNDAGQPVIGGNRRAMASTPGRAVRAMLRRANAISRGSPADITG